MPTYPKGGGELPHSGEVLEGAELAAEPYNRAMDHVISLDRFQVPLGGQEIELQQVEYGGGLPFLRVRIREGRRFTVFEIDPGTASRWGQTLLDWAHRQEPPARAP